MRLRAVLANVLRARGGDARPEPFQRALGPLSVGAGLVVCGSGAGRRQADGSRSDVVMSGVVDSGRKIGHGISTRMTDPVGTSVDHSFGAAGRWVLIISIMRSAVVPGGKNPMYLPASST